MVGSKIVLLCYGSGSSPVPYGSGQNITLWNDYKALVKCGYRIIVVEFGKKKNSTGIDKKNIIQIELSMYPVFSHLNWIKYQIKNIISPLTDPKNYFYPQWLGVPAIKFKDVLEKYKPSFVFCENIGPVITTFETGVNIPVFCTILDMDYVLKTGKEKIAKKKRGKSSWKLPLANMRSNWKNMLHRRFFHRIINNTKIRAVSNVDYYRIINAGGDSLFIPIQVGISPDENRLEEINKRLTTTAKKSEGKTVTIIHIGTVKSSHNSAGLIYFLKRCLSQLSNKIDFIIKIIGNNKSANQNILKYSDNKHVEFTGYVDDLESELANADFAIVPPGFDTGFRTKLPEAFAYGLPVVTDSSVLRGVGLKLNDPRVMVADTPIEFAAACNRLIEDSELRCRMGKIALETWEKDYGSEKVINDTAIWINENAD